MKEIIEVVKTTLEPRPQIYEEEGGDQEENTEFETKQELMEITQENDEDPAIEDMDVKPAMQWQNSHS